MRTDLARTVGLWALLLPSVLVLQPAFGGWQGFVPGLAGITAGVLLGFLAGRWRWSLLTTVLAAFAVYLLLGGAAALPRTTIAGVVPTLDTLQRLVLLVVFGWRDLLTVATPAGDFTGPAVVPWLTGLVAGVVAATLAVRTRAVYWPLAVPVVALIVGIAFGVRLTPAATWLGAALAAGLVAWVWAHRAATQRSDNADILINRGADAAQLVRQGIAALAVLALAAGASVAANQATGPVNRKVLRDAIVPPLNLSDYPSPLMSMRRYLVDEKDETLFTVSGMADGTRLRLAVLDTYDGNVFNVSPHANHYLRTGRSILQEAQPDQELAVQVGAYQGVWVPLTGTPSWLEFTAGRDEELGESTYYNTATRQALSTAGLTQGDAYQVRAVGERVLTPEERDALGASVPGNVPLAELERVPELLVTLAADYAEGQGTAYQQLVAIERALQENGFYSDGTDGVSLSGHTTERLSRMFRSPAIVGDEEQYATAMAIMANQLGVPARVVMGFYPDNEDYPEGEWQVKGTHARAWVEAHFAGVGWVTFNPTPDRDKEPETEVPRPKPKPKPQVDPPPNPPEKLPEDPVVADQDPAERDGDDESAFDWALVWLALGILGGAGLVAAPFLVILGLKARRTSARRSAEAIPDRVAGAWDDIVDRARDIGYRAAQSNTRREAAARLQDAYAEVPVAPLATRVDALVFGPEPPTEADSEAAWRQADEVKARLLHQVPWYRRPGAALSLRSLRKARIAPAPDQPSSSGDDNLPREAPLSEVTDV